MKLSISSCYNEPGYDFKISHKVNIFIQDQLTEKIFIKFGLDKIEPDKFIGFSVSTDSKTKKTELKGPHFDRRNNFEVWGVWLPYQKITNSPDQLSEYLQCFFDAIVKILRKFKVKEKDVRTVQKIVENEVIDNGVYVYEEIEKTPYVDIDKVLGRKPKK